MCDLYYAKAHHEFEVSRFFDTDHVPSLPPPLVLQPPQASFRGSHAVAETAENPSVTFSPVGSWASLKAEPEDGKDDSSDVHDAILDVSPIKCESLVAILPPYIRKEANQVILTLLTETLDPRRTLRQALENDTQGRQNIDCMRVLRRLEDRMREHKSPCDRDRIMVEAN